jgi:Holliday junction resolvasome RuvABC ATP-dependent DNA helicase subunit
MNLYSVDWKEWTGPGPRLKDIVGQEQVVARLRAFAQLHESSGTAPGHILLIAPEGMGQMLVAAAFAGEFGANSMAMAKGPEFEVTGDFNALFANLRERQFLLIPGVHFLRKPFWKGFREIMRSNQLTITIGQGPAARNHVMEVRPFTMIATCSKLRDCPTELFDGFSLVLSLEPYSRTELSEIAIRIARKIDVSLELGANELLAGGCNESPGDLELIMRRLVRSIGQNNITSEDVRTGFQALGIRVASQAAVLESTGLHELSDVDSEKLVAGLPATSTNLRALVEETTMLDDTTNRNFDLNIEKVLEGWETRHAIREIIANALDEQMLSQTEDVQIFRNNDGVWHIRDFGRGLRYEHLTQNENEEKLKNPSKVIGKFGVGLKDALATFNRRDVDICIRSRYGDITLGQIPKSGFTDVVTLHAIVHPSQDNSMIGTDVILRGASDDDVEEAKNFFLKFSGEPVLDETPYGQILQRDPNRNARIYITGMLVAEEENFAFSFNITSLTAAMRKALNRERTNVGRTAYSERVKQMLLASKSTVVANALVDDLMKIETGTNRDEVKWMDVAVHASQTLSASGKVVFVTATELISHKDAIDHAQADGLRIVTVPDSIKNSLQGTNDIHGNAVRDLSVYQTEWAQSFQFKFVTSDKLSRSERAIFEQWRTIADLVGGLPTKVREIKISETMRPDFLTAHEAEGLWEPASSTIIIKRTQLNSVATFAGTLLHEIAHASSGYGDVTRNFESELTRMLGVLATSHLTPRRGVVSRWFGF